jgi:hypothetical protein
MLKSSLGVAVLAAVIGVSGCASRAETVGAATGVAIGAGIGGGTLGAVGGGLLGYGIGSKYDERQNQPR